MTASGLNGRPFAGNTLVGAGGAALPPLLVVELGQRIGAAVCASLLAQLGATVISVEHGSIGKGAFRDELSAGKLRCTGGTPDEALLASAVASADVVLLSSDMPSPDARIESTQIVCDITASGGQVASTGESDAEIQALTGILHTTGSADGAPVVCPIPIIEYIAGLNAAAAILAALRVRRQSGLGQSIEVALYDCGFSAMASLLARLVGAKATSDIGRIGNRHGLSSPWNVYRASDGWLQVCTGSDDQWQRLCALMQRVDLAHHQDFARSTARVANNAAVDAAVQSWAAARTVDECVAALTSASIAGGAVVPVLDYPRERNLDHRKMIRTSAGGAFRPASPLRMSRTPGRAETEAVKANDDEIGALAHARQPVVSAARPNMPLAGVRVLEIGHYTTAPAAARVFAALGADVIKIEPPEGEASRGWPPIERGQSTFYTITNSGKRSVVLDLAKAEGRNRLSALVASSDILIENLKPGTLAKRGFGADALMQINRRLIYCGISGFGADSAYPGRPAFDTVVQGMSGLMHLIRDADGTPLKTGISVADVMGAATAVVCVLAALEERERSGRGQTIDLSMQDIMAWATHLAWNGKAFAPDARVLRAADGYVLATGTVGEPGGLAAVTRDEAVVRLRSLGVRCVPVLTPAEMLRSERTADRGLLFNLSDDRGEWPSVGIPMRLSMTPPQLHRPSPLLGRDTEAVLADLSAGASANRVQPLRACS